MLGFFGNLINFFQAIPELLILKVLKIYFKRQILN
jgi:hypothetical protein